MATTRERWALHVLQAGAIAVVLVALPYKVFDLDRFFVPKELVLHVAAALAALLCLAGRRAIRLTIVDILLADFLAVSLISTILSTNHWAAERAFAISLSGAALFWAASALRRVGLVLRTVTLLHCVHQLTAPGSCRVPGSIPARAAAHG